MGLIKAETVPSTRVVPFSMADIEKQARARLARAQQQAEQVLAAAQREGELFRERARAEGAIAGHEQGLAQGVEEGTRLGRDAALAEHRDQLTSLVTTLAAAAEQLNADRAELEVNVLREVVTLAVRIAERVTKRAGELEPAVLLGNVGEALKLVVGMHNLRIAIHPTQKAVLADALPRLTLQFPTLHHVELIEDASVSPGGCRLLTRQGCVDATLEEQLGRIAAEVGSTQSSKIVDTTP